jgi:hypothetical protein
VRGEKKRAGFVCSLFFLFDSFKPVVETEPDGVGEVVPANSKWDLFRNLERNLQTGDVVLFVGHGWVGSTVQKYQVGSEKRRVCCSLSPC